MDLLHLLLLAIIQGITEFLPISSSGHLILLSRLLDWEDQGLVIDVACHFGTLFAALFYFRKDLLAHGKAITHHDGEHWSGNLLVLLAIASVPLGLAGLLLAGFISEHLRSTEVIAWSSLIFAVFLWLADRFHRQQTHGLPSWKKALLIGCAQVLALIPGASRAGVTLTAGLALGLDRSSAARFAMLLAMPAIVMAAGYEGMKLVMSNTEIAWLDAGIAFAFSALTGYLGIILFLGWVQRFGLLPFVIYRILLSVFLFTV